MKNKDTVWWVVAYTTSGDPSMVFPTRKEAADACKGYGDIVHIVRVVPRKATKKRKAK